MERGFTRGLLLDGGHVGLLLLLLPEGRNDIKVCYQGILPPQGPDRNCCDSHARIRWM